MVSFRKLDERNPHRLGSRPETFTNMFDETIIAVLMIGVSIGLDYLCQAIFVGG